MAELEDVFRRLEEQVPPPVKEGYKNGFVLRYVEQTPQQAVLQNFARLISGLHSLRLLLASGFPQETGVIQRTLDDFGEDILFIALAVANDDMTDHHKQYLEYHWMEERGKPGANRGQVARKHIRAYVAKRSGDDPSITRRHSMPLSRQRAEAPRRRRGSEPVRRQHPSPPARNLVKPATLVDRRRRVRIRRQREVVLITDAAEEMLGAGDAAGFKAGTSDGHHLQNRSTSEALVLEVGTRLPGDGSYYSDIDMMIIDESPVGHTRRDGTLYARHSSNGEAE
jgi:hypothetical protein